MNKVQRVKFGAALHRWPDSPAAQQEQPASNGTAQQHGSEGMNGSLSVRFRRTPLVQAATPAVMQELFGSPDSSTGALGGAHAVYVILLVHAS